MRLRHRGFFSCCGLMRQMPGIDLHRGRHIRVAIRHGQVFGGRQSKNIFDGIRRMLDRSLAIIFRQQSNDFGVRGQQRP